MYQLNNITVIKNKKTILKIDQLDIKNKGLTVILGHNGSGKSTLVKLLAKQERADSGTIILDDIDLEGYSYKNMARKVAYLPQSLPQSPGLTVYDLVKLGRHPWRGVVGRYKKSDLKAIDDAIAHTNLEHKKTTLIDELSGGEKQRAYVAMLMAQNSTMLILDEPTSALDVKFQYQIMELLARLCEKLQKTILIIVHDINLALRYATDIIALKQGEIFYAGNKQNFSDNVELSQLYSTDITLINHPKNDHKVAIVC